MYKGIPLPNSLSSADECKSFYSHDSTNLHQYVNSSVGKNYPETLSSTDQKAYENSPFISSKNASVNEP